MDKKQIVFIINPKSGTSNKDVIPSLIEKHIDSSIYDVKCIFTEYAGGSLNQPCRPNDLLYLNVKCAFCLMLVIIPPS